VPVMGTDAGFVESVAQLKAGGEYSFHRYELPDDHPSRRDGLSILNPVVISRLADIERQQVSHFVSSGLCLKIVSFFDRRCARRRRRVLMAMVPRRGSPAASPRPPGHHFHWCDERGECDPSCCGGVHDIP
jgi:hypothetical protein